MSDDRASKALNAAVEALIPFFDTVQIFVTKSKDDDMTIGQTMGKGSLFARLGQIEVWLAKTHTHLQEDGQSEDEEEDEE